MSYCLFCHNTRVEPGIPGRCIWCDIASLKPTTRHQLGAHVMNTPHMPHAARYAAEPWICPCCGDDEQDKVSSAPDDHGSEVYRYHRCQVCNGTWTDKYTLASVTYALTDETSTVAEVERLREEVSMWRTASQTNKDAADCYAKERDALSDQLEHANRALTCIGERCAAALRPGHNVPRHAVEVLHILATSLAKA